MSNSLDPKQTGPSSLIWAYTIYTDITIQISRTFRVTISFIIDTKLRSYVLTLLHSKKPKLNGVLAVLSAIGLMLSLMPDFHDD